MKEKKPIRLRSNTHYFDPEATKLFLVVSNPDTYKARQTKIEGYETRLYWQFLECLEKGGQTFFYTLTYNDKSMPHYLGKNCFDYEDLRGLFTGGFVKRLARSFGTKVKYFVGAELGDGKGSRGLHNNPHYHILFFLLPDDSKNAKPYIKILPETFRHYVRMYWQGFDEDERIVDYRSALYGIAKEGDFCGLVKDFRAVQYVAKYVTKDATLKKDELRVKGYWYNYYRDSSLFYREVVYSFCQNVLYPCLNASIDDLPDLPEDCFIDDLQLSLEELYSFFLDVDKSAVSHSWHILFPPILEYSGFTKEFAAFFDAALDDAVRLKVNEYRNRFCNKCRISNGVGAFALDFIDKSNPCVCVPDKKGFKNRPLPLYYYRKLFTNYMIDSKGSVIRYLNNDGQEYKMRKLDERLRKCKDSALSNLLLVRNDRKLFDSVMRSDLNDGLSFLFKDLQYIDDEILNRYAEFKQVYEGRFFKHIVFRDRSNNDFPSIDVHRDYRRFLFPAVYYCTCDDLAVTRFLASPLPDYLAYDAHPYFLRYMRYFRFIDLLSDYLFISDDDKKQKEAEDIAAVRRFHSKLKMKEYLKSL